MISEPASNSDETDFSDLSLASEQDRQESFVIVGIGASAGGLDAFTQILQNLPTDTGMGFVLIQHLAPQYDSQLSEILQRATEMPVHEAREGMRIEPNSVYVIPPNTLMTLVQGVLKLEPRQRVRGKYMAIDAFFSSLAADCGNLAIAVVLSGSNEDGTAGLGVIKSVGGITFAQDLVSAEFPTMPMIAIASGYVDFVLSPAEIVTELLSISQSKSEIKNMAIDDENNSDEYDDEVASIFAKSQEALTQIFSLLHDAMGVDFSQYKQGTVKRRISRRMGLLNIQKLDEYAQYLQAYPHEVERLYHDILINVTSFFRDPESFIAFQQLVFPTICQNKTPDLPIRIWVVGCSTGEEAYSIAICLLEFFDDFLVRHPIQIFATDISEIAIEKARQGIYSQNLLTDVSPERLRRFFTPVQGGYQISKSVRELCVFARQNLTSDPPFSRLDLISCRNMLIYLEPSLQKKIMPIFHYALNPDGFLILGSSEGIGNATDLFEITNKKYRIYQRKLTPPRMNFNFGKSTYVADASSLEKSADLVEDINLEQIADQVVLNRYAPVGVTVDSNLEILKFRGQTSPFLEPAPGKASLNLLKMARSELKLELRSLIHSAKHQDIPVCKDGIEIQQDLLVKIDVVPLRINSDRFFLVLFESRPNPSMSTNLAIRTLSKSRKLRQIEAEREVIRLTYELENTKEYLRSIIESQETINQDLKVAGEEFLSSNEELQSANEELETAKEEIQATNEELSTINDELRNRNIQLHTVNNDLQNLLSSVNIPILMLSGDLRIRRFTPMAEQLFNLIASDVGRPFSDIQTNIEVPHLINLMTSVIDTLIPYEQDVQDRTGHWHSLRIRPYRTTDDRIDGVVISLIDIDLLKRNAIALESARNYANAIVETLRQTLIVLNFELQVITANRAFYETFQMTAAQVERQSIFELGRGDWDMPKMRSLLNETLLMDISVHDYEITQKFSQLGTRTMLLNACQIEQSDIGKMILIAIEDITERKLQKQQLIAQNQELSEAIIASEAASRAKSKFLSSMSHELRTPLNAIMGFTQLLQLNGELDQETQEFATMIYQSSQHLLFLIQDLLDIAKIEADKMEIQPSALSFENFLQITVDMVSHKSIDKNLTLTTQFAPDLPKDIYADEHRLRQVLLNLLGNAIKFTSAGEIIFAVSKVQSTEHESGNLRDLIRFAITDTGIGIADSDLGRIFWSFEQAGEEMMKSQGTGLGLAISQNLVQKMGGEITVQSKLGKGSTFSFELDLTELPAS
ncbi:CheR family methyltransferase [Pseudanabaena sp. ABRG5-3]|uniref:CheR family methyltransferase n=1 Tax=Pseudanabaena sp. ABRG5-3 TaxID=685565 RepID=UPI000DC739F7|nr:CheR family methyltransferase [Pseudanabaena sp. ABRG5-3]BBC22641.1 multi-sensor hybrid histidine kinase [Pseudanabaena sp. ABRG5-3]